MKNQTTRFAGGALMLFTAGLMAPQAGAATGTEVGRMDISIHGSVVATTKCTFSKNSDTVDFGEIQFSSSSGYPTIAPQATQPLATPSCAGSVLTAKMYLAGNVVGGADSLLATNNQDLGIQLWVNGTKQKAGYSNKFDFNTGNPLTLAAQLVQINRGGSHLKDGPFTASGTLHIEFP